LTERGYLNDQQSVTIEIEIFFSHLLFAPEYTPLDDIVRKQKQQIMYVSIFIPEDFSNKSFLGVSCWQLKMKIFN
jgi:hypothetical protein